MLPDLSRDTAARFVGHVQAIKQDGDLALASLHWGTNWGYEVPRGHVRFARWLVDGGIDVVHGHSSHHPRPLEIYRGRPIFYGCGDLINDYEGIGGHKEFRDDFRLLYFATLDAGSRELRELHLVPVQARRMRLERASKHDGEWLRRVLSDASAGFGTRFSVAGDGSLSVGVP
ncbi:CapA family protein [Arthrobacter sp. NPDC089319]|uniref:CapA family protein n=1 Tax=Arthrobacter sp. NPDC089319 TaxID=3155915 RepID=UPI003441D0B1